MATAQEEMQVKQLVREAMTEQGVSAETLISLGQMAQDVLKDKSLYPQFIQAIIDSDLAEEGDIPLDIDYQLIGVFVVIGEMTKKMIASGELGE
jgi:hypothetical protein